MAEGQQATSKMGKGKVATAAAGVGVVTGAVLCVVLSPIILPIGLAAGALGGGAYIYKKRKDKKIKKLQAQLEQQQKPLQEERYEKYQYPQQRQWQDTGKQQVQSKHIPASFPEVSPPPPPPNDPAPLKYTGSVGQNDLYYANYISKDFKSKEKPQKQSTKSKIKQFFNKDTSSSSNNKNNNKYHFEEGEEENQVNYAYPP